MSSVQHYDNSDVALLLTPVDPTIEAWCRPGVNVTHLVDSRARGLIVAAAEKVTVLWSIEPELSNVGTTMGKQMAFPIAKRHNYASIAKSIINIEPMPNAAKTLYFSDAKKNK